MPKKKRSSVKKLQPEFSPKLKRGKELFAGESSPSPSPSDDPDTPHLVFRRPSRKKKQKGQSKRRKR